MQTTTTRILAVLTVAVLAPASYGGIIRPFPTIPPNPNFQIAPGLSLNHYAYNTAVIGQALG